MMALSDMCAPLEAILYASGTSISEKSIMEILKIDYDGLMKLIEFEKKSLDDCGSGLMLQHVAGGWQMVTRPELYPYIEGMAKTIDRKLSNAAMETLSIVAFRQPITKQEIEEIRGVSSERILSMLVSRELIKEVGRKKAVGRPILYGTTDTFLRAFGINDISELPDLPEAHVDETEKYNQMTLDVEENENTSFNGISDEE